MAVELGRAYVYDIDTNLNELHLQIGYLYSGSPSVVTIKNKNCKYLFQGDAKEGVVRRGIVWFYEKNEEAAKEALVGYYNDKIAELNTKKDYYEQNLKILEAK